MSELHSLATAARGAGLGRAPGDDPEASATDRHAAASGLSAPGGASDASHGPAPNYWIHSTMERRRLSGQPN